MFETLFHKNFGEDVWVPASFDRVFESLSGSEIANDGEIDESSDGGDAGDGVETVESREKFVGAGQIQKDGIDSVIGKKRLKPHRIYYGTFFDVHI